MSFHVPPTFPSMATMIGFSPPLPSPLTLSQPVMTQIVLEPKVPTINASNYHDSDPVTKAVMDNIMGKLPTKKPVVVATCDICKLECSGQIVLDMHLAGAKHAKKVKSQEILAQLQNTGETFTSDEKTKILKCEVCNIVVNSSQQLQTHLSGNKHKQKALKVSKSLPINGNGVPASKSQNPIDFPKQAPSADNTGCIGQPTNGSSNGNSGANSNTGPKRMETMEEVQPGIQLVSEGTGAKTKKYFCDKCNIPLNSDVQLEQHIGSKKHKDKLSKPKQRPTPYWRRPRANYQQGANERGENVQRRAAPLSVQYHNPLSSNFISSGAFSTL